MQSFKVAPLKKSTQVLQLLIMGLLPVVLLVITAVIPEVRSAYHITLPAGIAMLLIIFGLAMFTGRRRIGLNEQELIIAATMYTRKFLHSQIKLDEARIVNLEEHPEFKPMLKTNGYSIPGFQAGYFRSRKWKKMFCLITNPRVLLLPLQGSEQVIVISPERPQALLDALGKATIESF
ncbi:MAG: PH domain-containing protein [Pseudomonadota bacterium]